MLFRKGEKRIVYWLLFAFSKQHLATVVIEEMKKHNVEVETIRLVDHNILHGVTSDEGNGDEWPLIHEKLIASEILVIATPTWIGHPSSIAQRVRIIHSSSSINLSGWKGYASLSGGWIHDNYKGRRCAELVN